MPLSFVGVYRTGYRSSGICPRQQRADTWPLEEHDSKSLLNCHGWRPADEVREMQQLLQRGRSGLVVLIVALFVLVLGAARAGASNPNTTFKVDYCVPGSNTVAEWSDVSHLSFVRDDWFDSIGNYIGSRYLSTGLRSGYFPALTPSNATEVHVFWYGHTRKAGDYLIDEQIASCS
jgi:hypothetical protein